MKLLLDTHAFIWAVHDPDRLTARVTSALLNDANDLYVSSATAWEIATKHRIGKLANGDAITNGMAGAIESLQAEELAISIAHGLAAGAFPVEHRDPFDRLLAAQAMIEGAAMVSIDRAFADFPVTVLW